MSAEREPDGSNRSLIFSTLVIMAVLATAFVLARPHSSLVKSPLIDSLNKLSTPGKALALYSGENQGRRPKTLDELVPAYCSNELLSDKYPGHNEPLRWIYYPGHTEEDAPEIVIATSPVARRGWWVVLLM
jgi:hypothetical protein